MSLDFRTRLIRTLRAVQPVLEVPGVLVAGSEVPNLLQPEAASTLVISQDVDIAVPVDRHAEVKKQLRNVALLKRSEEEPSVWLPINPDLIEVNFIGVDAKRGVEGDTYVLDDPELPLMVFAGLSLLRSAGSRVIEDLPVPLPRPAGLLLEKLMTDRSGEKGDRDLLVGLGLLLVSGKEDKEELLTLYRVLPPELRYQVRFGLTTLSLLEPRLHMPDPEPHRAEVAELLAALENEDRSQ